MSNALTTDRATITVGDAIIPAVGAATSIGP